MLATMITAADLRFDADTHVYTTPDGQRVPNVTSILDAVGVRADFVKVNPQHLEYRRQLGHAVHEATHYDDEGDLVWESVDPRAAPYVEAWRTFSRQKSVTIERMETRVFHPHFFYCGTFDRVMRDSRGKRVLVDIKIGDPKDAAAHLQTAAYKDGYQFEHPADPIDERWSVQLVPDRPDPYAVTVYKDFRDALKWQACLTVFHEQPTRRSKVA